MDEVRKLSDIDDHETFSVAVLAWVERWIATLEDRGGFAEQELLHSMVAVRDQASERRRRLRGPTTLDDWSENVLKMPNDEHPPGAPERYCD